MKKLFSIFFAAVMAGAMMLMTACGGETGDLQKQLDELTQQNEEYSERLDSLQAELEELQSKNETLSGNAAEMQTSLDELLNEMEEVYPPELQEPVRGLRSLIWEMRKENAPFSEVLEVYQIGMFILFDLDFTKRHVGNRLTVYIRPEYADKELTAEDFLSVEVVEINYHSYPQLTFYDLTLAQSGDEYLFRSAAKLYQLEFVESVDLVRILSGT